jgi:hypothetical protein|tara:strand:- start:881 stop:994 length:114 start_codon:yes stop_codon:yes gene_type:complete
MGGGFTFVEGSIDAPTGRGEFFVDCPTFILTPPRFVF